MPAGLTIRSCSSVHFWIESRRILSRAKSCCFSWDSHRFGLPNLSLVFQIYLPRCASVCDLNLCLYPCVSCYLFHANVPCFFLPFCRVNPPRVSFILPSHISFHRFAPIFISCLMSDSSLNPLPLSFFPSISLLLLYPLLHLCFEVTTTQTLSNGAS